jgi:hypothetical protein
MICELKESEYKRVRPVFDGLWYNLVIDSVIDGNTLAWVYITAYRNQRRSGYEDNRPDWWYELGVLNRILPDHQ